MGRTWAGRRRAQWVGATALATAAVACGVALMAAPAEEYPAIDGWIREPEASKAAPRAAGDPSRAAVAAELADAAAAAGLAAGRVHPAEEGGTADCIADWTGVALRTRPGWLPWKPLWRNAAGR
ncbi:MULTISPECIES: hypothetical protein [Streptomyces]|uniref:Uncharacterized protein n=1 Tax=Streptomyces virginiae TaxID=1961 RepID=A0ABZ1T4G7_STRVG|nr:hypothetical protein [Streptomyces virginiae]